jgi:hypothetical protein
MFKLPRLTGMLQSSKDRANVESFEIAQVFNENRRPGRTSAAPCSGTG